MDETNITQGGIHNEGDITLGQGDVIGRDKITNVYADAPLALSLHQLPAPPPTFTGRAEELNDLLSNFEAGVAISGLHGLGGVGKTALALKLAEALAPRYPDAQFYLDLRGTSEQPLTPAEAMAHIVRAYYPASKLPESEAELGGLYRSVLQAKRALLVMDNAKDAAQTAPLLPPPTCALIVTSREKFALPGLKARSIDAVRPDDARDLLIKIAPRLSNTEHRLGVGAVDEIASLCGYLPLALIAAGGVLAVTDDLDPADYAAQLRDEQARLELTGLTAEGVPISVEASLNLSYARLSPEAARVFRTLAVFPADFEAIAEETICEDEGHKQLSELVRRSLVQFDGKKKRYWLHELVRIFLKVRYNKKDRMIIEQRHATYYKFVLNAANSLCLSGGELIKRGLDLFDLEWGNIQTGQIWVVAHATKDETVLNLCSAYPNAGFYVFGIRLHPRDWIHWLEAALFAARKLKDRAVEGWHLGNLGNAHLSLGDTQKAINFHEQHLKIARRISNRRGESNAVGGLGNVYYSLGNTRQALKFYKQLLKIARETGSRHDESNALGSLGNVYAELGESNKAIQYYLQCLIIKVEIGDWYGQGATLGNMGQAHAELGRISEAIEFYEKSLTIKRLMRDIRGEGNTLFNLSLALEKLDNRAQAIIYAADALKIFEQIESPHAEKVRKQLAEWQRE